MDELKRRRAFRVAAGYGALAFGVLQLAEPVMHGLHLPDVTLTWTLLGLAIGFPVAVVAAWARDVSKEAQAARVAGASARTNAKSATPWNARTYGVLGCVALIASLPGIIGYLVISASRTPTMEVGPTTSAASAAASASGSAPAPAPTPTTLIGLPLPASSSAPAIAAYRRALQSLADAAWNDARVALEEAVALDPGMAMAHLRLAEVLLNEAPARARQEYRIALQLRATLDARNQTLLDALEPVLGHDPPDPRETFARLQRAAERFPMDAELAEKVCARCAAGMRPEPDSCVATCARATELDPAYADAWQVSARVLSDRHREDEARDALDRCLKLVPTSHDCRMDRAGLDNWRGDCAAVEDGARQGHMLYERAQALLALGRSEDVVIESLAADWAAPERMLGKTSEAYDRAALDVLAGRFASAEARLRAASAAVAADRNESIHGALASMLVDVLTESGRIADADRIAADYLARRELWLPGSDVLWDSTPRMLGARLRAGAVSQDEWRARVAEWVGKRLDDPGGWIFAFPPGVATPDQAAIALAQPMEMRARPWHYAWPSLDAEVGKTMLLAGRADDALPRLRRAAKSCYLLAHPFTHTRAHAWLGQALEAKADVHGACQAYRVVVDRWGRAKPQSATAERVRARIKALGCVGK